MTRFEQVDALELFRDGEFKVIMATTIAEEGLDIKECNLIVRYDYAGSSISMMQARGKVTNTLSTVSYSTSNLLYCRRCTVRILPIRRKT